MSAAEDPSPGIPKRIDVRSPVVPVTASMPSRKQKASMGVLIVYENGNINARVDRPPMPGSRPTQKPMKIPSSIYPKAGQARTFQNPITKASSI